MEGKNFNKDLRMAVFASLFTALIIVGAYISFDIGGAPFVLSNLFILMAGTLLGIKWGVISVSLYVLLGAAGLPVFSRGGAGISHILGPTGGFIIGFLIAVIVTAIICSKNNKTGKSKSKVFTMILDFTAMLSGLIVMYLIGLPWFGFTKGMGISQVLGIFGIFIVFDIIKIVIALFIIPFLRPIINKESSQ